MTVIRSRDRGPEMIPITLTFYFNCKEEPPKPIVQPSENNLLSSRITTFITSLPSLLPKRRLSQLHNSLARFSPLATLVVGIVKLPIGSLVSKLSTFTGSVVANGNPSNSFVLYMKPRCTATEELLGYRLASSSVQIQRY